MRTYVSVCKLHSTLLPQDEPTEVQKQSSSEDIPADGGERRPRKEAWQDNQIHVSDDLVDLAEELLPYRK